MIDPDQYGLVEMLLVFGTVLAFAFYQLWTVRGAGQGKSGSADDAGHSEGEHLPDDRR